MVADARGADTSHPLAEARSLCGWTQEALAARLRAAGLRTGVAIATSKKTVAKWEHGVIPDPFAQRLLATVFNVPEQIVRSRPWPAWLPSGRFAGVSDDWTVAGTLSSLQDIAASAEIDRRTLLALTGPALLLPVHSWLLERVPEAVGAVRGQRVSGATAHRIRRVTKELRLLDEQLGGGSVQEIVKEHLNLVIAILRRASYSDAIGRQLFAAAAELSQMAGFHEFDLGRHSAAQQYYLGALRSAHASGDRALGAHVLSFLSYQAYSVADPADALKVIRAAQLEAKGHVHPRAQALLMAREALACARLGERSAADRAVGASLAATAGAPVDEAPEYLCWFTDAEAAGMAGRAFLEVRDYAQAQQHLALAIRIGADFSVRSRAIYSLRLATAHLRQRRLDEACGLAEQAVMVADGVNSPRLIESIRNFQSETMPYAGEAEVQQLNEFIAEQLVSAGR